MRPTLRSSLICLILPLVACKTGDDVRPPTPASAAPAEMEKAQPMAEHFLQISALKDAVVAGDLAATQSPAQWLTEQLVADDLPLRWRPHVPAIRRAAESVLAASDLEAAAYGAAEAAAVCGQCHADVGIELAPTEAPAPLQDDSQFALMGRHAWAVNRMWDGLVAPSDEAWQEGIQTFITAPLHTDGASEELVSLGNRVHGIAATAANQTEPADRAGHFAALIATCADCHTQAKAAAAGG